MIHQLSVNALSSSLQSRRLVVIGKLKLQLRPQKATPSVPTFCGRDYGRDVVPLGPAVREANPRKQVVPRACPPRSMAGLPVGLHISYGSVCELETQVLLAGDLGFIAKGELGTAKKDIVEIERMLKALIKSLENKPLDP